MTDKETIRHAGGHRVTSRIFSVLVAAGFVFGAAGNAAAGSLTCPGTQITTDREHTLTLPGASVPIGCVTGSGPNDINGSAAQDIFVQAGWTFLDKDQNPDAAAGAIPDGSFTVSSFGGSTAHFDITQSVWQTFTEIAIGFKVGNTAPTWAVFYLPYLTLSGDWSTVPTSHGGGLSHVTLYGKPGTPPPPPAVPEPASLLLLGTGLAATAAKLRRRKA
jgi:hypothetical protein